MPKYLGPAIFVVSAVYALAGVFSYFLYSSAVAVRPSKTLFPAACVMLPYLFLLFVYRFSHDKRSRLATDTLVVVSALIGAIAYADSFRQRVVADMYLVTYVAIPALQVSLAVGALLIVLMQRFLARRKGA